MNNPLSRGLDVKLSLNRTYLLKSICIVAALIVFATSADSKDDNRTAPIGEWLVLGPIHMPLPVYHDEGKSRVGAAELLAHEHIATTRLHPVVGSTIQRIGGSSVEWVRATADTNGVALPSDTTKTTVAYLAVYVDVPRWMKVELEAHSSRPFEVFMDGNSIVKREKHGEFDDIKKGTAKLEQGKHLLVVKTVHVPGDTLSEWRFGLEIGPGKKFENEPVTSVDPTREIKIGEVIEGPSVGMVRVSPGGDLVAMSLSRRTPPDGKSQKWIEIRKTTDGSLVRTLRDLKGVSGWQWAPTGNRLSYTVRGEEKMGSVRVLDLDSGELSTIIEGIEDFSGYTWSPDGTYIAYSINKTPEKSKTGVKRFRGLGDRRANDRDKSSVFVASVPGGMTRMLTAGELSTYVYDVHPDGRSLLIGRDEEDLSKRPYTFSELILVDLDTQEAEVLWKSHWFGNVHWSPDGKKILATGAATSFGGAGVSVPDNMIANDYDTQIYILDPVTKDVDPITKNFDPTVRSATWSANGRDIYIVAGDREYVRMFRYDVGRRTFKDISPDAEVIHSSSIAQNRPIAVVTASSAHHPPRVYTVNLKSGKSKVLLDPAAERFERIKIGNVDPWNFTMDGREIVGRVYYPPNFDPSRKWPCIVYYYGGTAPVTRNFGGRYPKNLWAAHGYVVYVPQPSGAIGFGQEYSARHVNDWGKIVAGEIIEGTKQFLAAHNFVDPERVGCIGASYGGFMTMLLVTKTDIYTAAVSHAGISSISSYWGEGYWGFGYSSVATANSFPWNRPDIYIDQSPLFGADAVTTPLLLLHGASDTNVPRGESDQMYAALKLLGKEVEYIRVDGEDHWILDYKKRIVWSNAIVSWFDRWLKDEPEWWNDMYPPLDEDDEGKDE